MNAKRAFRRFWNLLFSTTKGAAAVAQTTFARFIVVGFNVCTGIITARALGTVGRGELSALLLWPGLLSYLVTFGLPTAIRYWVRREPDREKDFLTVSLLAAIVLSTISSVVGIICMPSWLHNYSADVIRMAQYLMFSCPEMMIAVMMAAMMEALGKFALSNMARYLPVMITLFMLIVLAAFQLLTSFTAALAYTIPPVIIAVWIFWKLRDYIHFRAFDVRPALRLLSSYGIRAYGIDILGTLSQQIDQVIVVGVLSASSVGIYAVSLNASRVINVLHSAVVVVLFPSAAGLEKEAILEMVGRSARISTGIAAAFGGLLYVLYPILFPLLYGRSFDAAVSIARLLTLEAVLVGLVLVLGQAFMALGRPGFVTAMQLLGLAIVVPAMFLLLPRFGLIGAAFALLLSTAIRLVLILLSYPMILHVLPPRLIPMREDFARVRNAILPT
jgi:O-antigen/teichoic acid export membrane protein